jgi:hypothetical protein
MLLIKPLGNLSLNLRPGSNIAGDFRVFTGGNIRYVGSGTSYTVLELHRWLQDLADQAAMSNRDVLDITSNNPSTRETDHIIYLENGFNIDAKAAEHLREGSLHQKGDEIFSDMSQHGFFPHQDDV